MARQQRHPDPPQGSPGRRPPCGPADRWGSCTHTPHTVSTTNPLPPPGLFRSRVFTLSTPSNAGMRPGRKLHHIACVREIMTHVERSPFRRIIKKDPLTNTTDTHAPTKKQTLIQVLDERPVNSTYLHMRPENAKFTNEFLAPSSTISLSAFYFALLE